MSTPNPNVHAEAVPLDRLVPAPWNPRTITDERFRQLCRSLEADPDFLWYRPILATLTGTIFAGNQRYRAAASMGWKAVPTILVDIPEVLAKERAMRDNNAWGEWQDDDLAALLYELGTDGVDLTTLGFDDRDLARLLAESGALGDTPIEPPAATYAIVIECVSERQQADLLERFEAEGLTCRPMGS